MLATTPAKAELGEAGFNDVGFYDDYYDTYEVEYDNNCGDDWFYDYYEYDNEWGANSDYYNNYNYDADAFDWEEDGLFE